MALIAAVARNGVIGRDGQLAWHLPQDLQHFKRTTLGHPIVMGRKTYDSIGRALPSRRNIVVTRQAGWSAPGVEVAASLQEALAMVRESDRVYVIGGAQIYRAALPLADELVLTEIDLDVEGDVHFPQDATQGFEPVAAESHRSEAGYDYRFVTYRRRR